MLCYAMIGYIFYYRVSKTKAVISEKIRTT